MKLILPYPANKRVKSAFCREYGLNSIYAGKHWAKRRSDKEYWKQFVLDELKKQGIEREYCEYPVEIIFRWDDHLDCSNHAYMAKMIEDSFVGYILVDDNKKYVKRIVHEFHDRNVIEVEVRRYEPGVEITL